MPVNLGRQTLFADAGLPDLDNACFIVTPTIKNAKRGMTFKAVLSDGGSEVASSQIQASSGTSLILEIDDPQIWSLNDPRLYDLGLELLDGAEIFDSVSSYAGLRKFHIEGNKVFLNNEMSLTLVMGGDRLGSC